MFDTFSEARQHAAKMREFYDAYVSQGFSDEQAMSMVLILLAGVVTPR
ncbi:hypothetical protein [Allostreptomyces psammosilenae]|uniref:Uncharacterized protein n=1 Tax=Allostreptomyces psammosilenae TaxID=1892865 RepID=A0A853A6C0_9ACTN|nr:hypothetical protein [Allostreptomyces psammosilenae]NYI06088.1 hypothetical protein [Allostreptomyces psammosilenae]